MAISTEAHGSKLVVVSGHHGCAANPGSKEEHLPQINEWVKTIHSWNIGVEVIGVWVDENWSVNQI